MPFSLLRIPDPLVIISSRFFVMFLSYIQLNVFLILVGVSEYGKFVIIQTSLNYAILLGSLGLNLAITRKISFENHLTKKTDFMLAAFILSIFSSIIMSSFFFILADFLSTKIYNDSSLILYFSLISLGIVPAILNNNIIGMLRGLQEMKKISLALVIAKGVSFSISMFLVLFYGLWGMILGLLIFHIGSLIFSSILFSRSIKIKKLIQELRIFKQTIILIRTGLSYYVLGLLHQITFLIGYAYVDVIAGHEQIAYYAIAYFSFTLLVTISTSFGYVIFPRVSKIEGTVETPVSSANNKKNIRMYKMIQNNIRYSFFLLFLLSFLFIGFRSIILSFFVEGYKVEELFLVLLYSVAFIAGLGNILVDGVLWGLSRFKSLAFIRIVYIFVYISIIFLLTDDYGAIALALALIFGWISNIILAYVDICFFYLKISLHLNPFFLKWKDWILIIPSYLLLPLVIIICPQLVEQIIILIICFLVSIYFTYQVATSEKRKSFLNSIYESLNWF